MCNIVIEAGMFFFALFHIKWPCKDYNFQTCLRDNLVPRMLEMAFQSLQISKFSGGACPQTPPPRLMGLMAPCSYSRLFFFNQLPTSNFIETPAVPKGQASRKVCGGMFPQTILKLRVSEILLHASSSGLSITSLLQA